MSISNLFRNAKKNPVSTIIVVVLAIAMVIVMIGDTVYTAGIYWITIVFFLVPRFIKDTMKLKEEQDLTI